MVTLWKAFFYRVAYYSWRSVVTQKLRKEYSDIQPILLWIKRWTVWYTKRYSTSTYTGVTNCQI